MHQSNTQPLRPQLHYNYKSQAVILDSQYNYEGNVLAVCNSQGFIYLYSTELQQSSKQPIFLYQLQSKKQLKNNAILKICWSLPIYSLFASCNIYQTITLFKVINNNNSNINTYNLGMNNNNNAVERSNVKSLEHYLQVTLDSIPISLAFCPIQTECILSVGLTDGKIKLYNGELEQIEQVQAHQQVVNCLAWDVNVYVLDKNKWVVQNLLPSIKSNPNPSSSSSLTSSQNLSKSKSFPCSYLLSCSSDSSIKLWKYIQSRLKFLGIIQKAHEKHIRMIDWKTSYFLEDQRTFVSCSEDFTVKIWSLKIYEDKCTFMIKGNTYMKGPVYKVKYNDIGNLLAVSYCNEEEQKVQTKIYKEVNGSLLQQIKIQS